MRMYKYMYRRISICILACISYLYVYAYVYRAVYSCSDMRIYIYIRVCMHACMHVCMYVCMRAYRDAHTHSSMQEATTRKKTAHAFISASDQDFMAPKPFHGTSSNQLLLSGNYPLKKPLQSSLTAEVLIPRTKAPLSKS